MNFLLSKPPSVGTLRAVLLLPIFLLPAAAATTPSVTVTPEPLQITATQQLTVYVFVFGGNSSPIPTGTVVLSSGSYASPQTALFGGTAFFTIPSNTFSVGPATLAASYTPDSASLPLYTAASGSASVAVTTPTVIPPCQSAPITLSAQTWSVIGPCGGAVYSLAVDPTNSNTLYAAAGHAGIFKSINAGASWIPINQGVAMDLGYGLFDVVVAPSNANTLYATTGGGYAFVSTDGGASWTTLSVSDFYIGWLAVDPSSSTTVYATGSQFAGAGVSIDGVGKSTDGGTTWTFNTIVPMGDFSIGPLRIDPQTPTTLYAADPLNSSFNYGLYKSTDGGVTWSLLSSILPNGMVLDSTYQLAIDPANTSTLYAAPDPSGGGFAGIYKSTDAGVTWTLTNNGNSLPVENVAVDTGAPANLYAWSVYGILYSSPNSGASWNPIGSPNGLSLNAIGFGPNPGSPSKLYTADGAGISLSANGGYSWTDSNIGIVANNISALTVDPTAPGTIYAGTGDGSGGGLFKSTNSGSTWTPASNGLNCGAGNAIGPNTVLVDPGTPSTVYVSGNSMTSGGYGYCGLFKSTDGAQTWTSAVSGLPDEAFEYTLAMNPAQPTTLYVGTIDGAYQSTDGAATWTAINNGLTVSGTIPTVLSLIIDPVTPTNLFALTWYDTQSSQAPTYTLFKSLNGGASWTAINTSPNSTYYLAFTLNPSSPLNLYILTETPSGVYTLIQSGDGGATWQTINLPANQYLTTMFFDALAPSTLYLAGNGVLASTDGGQTWNPISTGLNANVSTLATDSAGAVLYAGTTAGIYALSHVPVCTFTFSPSAVYIDSTAQSASISFTASATTCNWSASPASPFLTITSAASGTGNGSVSFSVTANSTGADRSGTLNIANQTMSVTQRAEADVFADVPPSAYYFDFADLMDIDGITAGCQTNPPDYCPNSTTTRGEMAVFLITSIFQGQPFNYPPTPYFTDVPSSNPFFPFIQELRFLGITDGCTAAMFCPNDSVTRGEMAVFIIAARYGSTPYAYPSIPYFSDVPASNPFFPFIQKMAQMGITAGCGSGQYCPNETLTRGQMAVFIVTGLLNQLLPAGSAYIASASPNAASPGQAPTVTLNGMNTNFEQGTTQITAPPGITVSNLTVTGPTTLAITLTLSAGVATNPVSLIVTTGTQEADLVNGFVVQ